MPRLSLVAVLCAALLPACSTNPPPAIDAGNYAGPPIELGTTVAATGGPQHTVILTAPTGGWAFRLDQTRREFERTQVFMTAVRPNPAYMQTQALVTHEVATGVPADRPIAVYARVLRHDEAAGGQGYVMARRSPQ